MKYISKDKLAYYTEKLIDSIGQGSNIINSSNYEFIKEIPMPHEQLEYELANYNDYEEVMFMIEKTYINSGSGNCWIRIGNINLGLLSNATYANLICQIKTNLNYIEVNQSATNNTQTGQTNSRCWKSPTFVEANDFDNKMYNVLFSQEYAETWADSAKMFVFGVPRKKGVDGTNFVQSASVRNIVNLTQSEYDGLPVKDETTLYIIKNN